MSKWIFLLILFKALLLPIKSLAKSPSNSNCPTGTHFVSSHPRRAFHRSDGTFVRATSVSAFCRTNQKSFELWNPKLKNGRPAGWPHKNEKPAKWTEEQKERILEALDELPEALWASSIKGLYRILKAKDFPNPSSWGKGVIALYDSAFDESRNLSRILSHELGHEKYILLTHAEAQDYRRVAGWRLEIEGDGTIVWNGRTSGYVDSDGQNSPSEDFANNVEYFLFEPNQLKQRTPAVYTWMQRHFGDSFKLRGPK